MKEVHPDPGADVDEPSTVRCRLCGDTLHEVADKASDEFVYVDAQGNQLGTDADLRRFGPGSDDAYAAFAALREKIRAHQTSRRGTMPEAAYQRAMTSYVALNTRLNNGTWHTHYPDKHEPYRGGPVPEHCGMPMWLRPSGWQCRTCRERKQPESPPPAPVAASAPGSWFTDAATQMQATGAAYAPDGAMHVLATIEGLPEALTAVAGTFRILAEHCDTAFPVHQRVGEALNEVFRLLQATIPAAEEVGKVFRTEHAADIARHEDPRTGEEMWDTTNND